MALLVFGIPKSGEVVKQHETCICGYKMYYYTIGGYKTKQEQKSCPICGRTITIYTSIK